MWDAAIMNRSPLTSLLVGLFPFLTVGANHTGATTLSDNLTQPSGYTEVVTPSTYVASSFGTGSYDSMLKTVDLLANIDPATVPVVSLYSDNSGQPGSYVGQLLSPTSYTNTLQVVAFGGNQLPLAGNSTYWIVAQAASGTGSYEWAYSNTDLGSGSGFQHTWSISYDAGADWFTSNTLPMQMAVQDSSTAATPEPTSFLLLGIGLLVVAWASRSRSYEV